MTHQSARARDRLGTSRGLSGSRRAFLAAGVAGLGALAGCSIFTGRSPSLEPTGEPLGPVEGAHPQLQYDAANSGYNPSTALPGGPVRAQWAVGTERAFPVPWTLVDDTLVAGVGDGTVVALDVDDGGEQWRHTTRGTPAVAVTGDLAVVIDEDGITGLSTVDGAEQWTRSAPSAGVAGVAPTVADGIYVGGRTPIALEPDGSVRWRYDGGAERGSGEPFGTPAAAEGTVYLSRPGELVAVDAAGGSERWSLDPPSDPDGFVGRPTPPALRVAADGDRVEGVYVGGPAGVVAATPDGQRAWHRDVGPIGGLAVTADRVVAGSAMAEIASQNATGMLFVLDATSGATHWQATDTEPGIGYGLPFVVRDRLFGGAARLAVQDVANGDIRWVLGATFERLLVLDGAVFIGTEDGRLYGCR